MIKDFKALKISIASPEDIIAMSHGEVTKAETINYRTFKPEPQGLMAEEIFGPSKNFECYCGKYKKIRYKGIVCDRCGVEVTHKRVRRERMGHIKLAAPVAHVWFSNGIPNKLSLILDIPTKKLESVVYYARFVVTEVNQEEKAKAIEGIPELKQSEIAQIEAESLKKITETENSFSQEIEEIKKTYKDTKKLDLQLVKIEKHKGEEIAKIKAATNQKIEALDAKFMEIKSLVESIEVGSTLTEEENQLLFDHNLYFYNSSMGAEAIKELLEKIDLAKEIERISTELKETRTEFKKLKLTQKLRVFKGMNKSGIRPEWMILTVLPVIPPDLRPIVLLAGGRFATYDLNDLYRRVINRNNRLNRLINLGAPEIILRNEKRMLQEAVDSLLDNNHKPGAPSLNSKGLPYKSLSDMLRGKQGRFRQNLLGKRVDYSGNAVIVPGPELRFDQCGLPKVIALELFKPFVLRELILRGHAPNPTRAKNILEAKEDIVYDILEDVIKGRPVLLNRAPTLHKQSILAFYPVLIEGNAIKLHPMTCTGFNADFDGDQMAVHLPLSEEAVEEAKQKMFAKSNILNLRDGSPIVSVSKDMAFGMYFLTKMEESKTLNMYPSLDTLIADYYRGNISFIQSAKVLYNGELIVTTAGRAIFNKTLPADFGFINKTLGKSDISKISAELFEKYGGDIAIETLDKIKNLGFKFAGRYGISVSMDEFKLEVEQTLNNLYEEFEQRYDNYSRDREDGYLTNSETRRLQRQSWTEVAEKVQDVVWNEAQIKATNLLDLQNSGAVPTKEFVKKISGTIGVITDPTGNIVDLPIKNNFEKGLTNFEYFVAARGARKGFADVALRTADSGYLTRRLHEVAQDVITNEYDCGTEEGLKLYKAEKRTMSFASRIKGRYLTKDVVSNVNKKTQIIASKGELIDKKLANLIANDETIDCVEVRSPLKCKTPQSVCVKCYGIDNGTNQLVELGVAVGTIASQSIGEPSTQLTLKSKSDARAMKTDVTQGLPRLEELLEVRDPKTQAVLSEIGGKVSIVNQKGKVLVRVNGERITVSTIDVFESDVKVKDGSKVTKNELLASKGKKEILSPNDGVISIKGDTIYLTSNLMDEVEYEIDSIINVTVKDGQTIEKGDPITYGSISPRELASLKDLEAAQKYVITEVQSVYGNNGIDIDDRHLEIILKQMTRFSLVLDGGDSEEYFAGDYVDRINLERENGRLAAENKKLIVFKNEIMGISNAALKTESFLAAASFEQQVKVLTEAAIIGKIDMLRGLKENIIIGKPIPLGSYMNNKNE
jgi:DNA-directed RNA polymerase subunit beta'